MNVIGLYGAIGWNVLISDNPKLLKQSEDSWTHGASVTLIKDGEHCVSISEERLSGIKYDGNFPRKSIEYCLSAANLDKNDIDLVIVPSMANQQFYKNFINKTLDLINTSWFFCGSFFVILTSFFFEIFIFGLIAGFLALLTPCVFPMIPLTVSYFIDESKLSYSGAISASLYGGFIVLIYILLSIPFHVFDSLNPNILNTISTNVYVNITFFVVFILFAISFFGYFDIVIPSNIISGSEKKSDKGGIIGIFFMSLTLALVSFSCTGPILGSLLAGSLSSAQSGATQLTYGMFGFGVALAFPFTLLAFYPKYLSLIPKSGIWLKKLKVCLGFIELALAFKFLSNADLVEGWGILKRETFIFIWVVIFLSMTHNLFGFTYGRLKFNYKSISGWVFLLFSFFLLSGLYDSKNVRLLSGILPPEFYSVEEKQNECPLGLNCFKNYDEGKEYAVENNKIILLDFTGWACANCRRMEENVWSKPKIFELLDNNYVIISLYVDDRTELSDNEKFKYINKSGRIQYINNIGRRWSLFQQINFNNASQPYYVAMLPSGKILSEPIQFTSDKKFQNWLETSIEESKL